MSSIEAIKADLTHSAALWGVRPATAIPRALGKILLYPRVRAVLLFRCSHAIWQCHAARPLAIMLQNYAARISGAEIHPAAVIGAGLNLAHSNGVVIGDKVRIGHSARLYQQVTIGDDGIRLGQPSIGDHVILGAGCKILGPIALGQFVTIAANAVVVTDLPDHSLAAGVPASVIKVSDDGASTTQ